MPNDSWREAIVTVLKNAEEPMNANEIAEAVFARGLRTEPSATPWATVASVISSSLSKDGDASPFHRFSKGLFCLRNKELAMVTAAQDQAEKGGMAHAGLINAFGMFWSRTSVDWVPRTPKILGQQHQDSTPVDFCEQRGVYLLYDRRDVVYVGRTTEQALGVRLRQHISDRLNSRWDRFSWFGVCTVNDAGVLDLNATSNFGIDMLITTLEALLIESLEPPQNRKRGDDFRAVEFLQAEDPTIKMKNQRIAVDEVLRAAARDAEGLGQIRK